MDDKKYPHFPDWRTWIMTVTLIIQLLTVVEYYHLWTALHDSASLQKLVLQVQLECLENLNQELENLTD